MAHKRNFAKGHPNASTRPAWEREAKALRLPEHLEMRLVREDKSDTVGLSEVERARGSILTTPAGEEVLLTWNAGAPEAAAEEAGPSETDGSFLVPVRDADRRRNTLMGPPAWKIGVA